MCGFRQTPRLTAPAAPHIHCSPNHILTGGSKTGAVHDPIRRTGYPPEDCPGRRDYLIAAGSNEAATGASLSWERFRSRTPKRSGNSGEPCRIETSYAKSCFNPTSAALMTQHPDLLLQHRQQVLYIGEVLDNRIKHHGAEATGLRIRKPCDRAVQQLHVPEDFPFGSRIAQIERTPRPTNLSRLTHTVRGQVLEQQPYVVADLQHPGRLQSANTAQRSLLPLLHLNIRNGIAGIAADPSHKTRLCRSSCMGQVVKSLPTIGQRPVHMAGTFRLECLLCLEPHSRLVGSPETRRRVSVPPRPHAETP